MARKFIYVWSSVGRKFFLAFAGLALTGFITVHLLGNLQLFSSNPTALDSYAHHLLSLGPILWTVEIVLALIFAIHIYAAIDVTLANRRARPERYQVVTNSGAPSRKTFSSVTMIWSGLTILTFLVLHVLHFKFGVFGGGHGTVMVDGKELRDFSSHVIEAFQNPWIVMAYLVALIWLGFHLRHGFWSAFQTIGVHHPKWTPVLYTVGTVFALIVGLGYLSIPIVIYFTGG